MSQSTEIWNRCDICGQFIAFSDFDVGTANCRMVSCDAEGSCEDYETLCGKHYRDYKRGLAQFGIQNYEYQNQNVCQGAD